MPREGSAFLRSGHADHGSQSVLFSLCRGALVSGDVLASLIAFTLSLSSLRAHWMNPRSMNKEHSVAFCRLLGFGAWALLMAACGDVSVDSPDTSGVNYASADAIGAHEPEGAQDAHGASESGEGEDALSEAAGELGPGTSPHDVMPSGGEERPDAERIGEGPDAERIGEGPDAALESALGPTRYDPGELHSPLTPFVVENLRSIAAIDDSLHDDVFAKIGASSMASTNTLACFAGSEVDAGLMPPASVDTWELFLEGDAGGEDPFSRTSLAALSGKTAAWAIDGASSPLISEVEAIDAPTQSNAHATTGRGPIRSSASPVGIWQIAKSRYQAPTAEAQAELAEKASAASAAEAKTAAEQAAAVRADLQSKQSQLQVQIAIVKAQYEALTPNQREALAAMPGRGVIVTAPGDEVDFVSRFFTPQATILEDPVTGSAHCTSAPYWAERLGQTVLRARQILERGGDIHCQVLAKHVLVSGHAVTYARSKVFLPDA